MLKPFWKWYERKYRVIAPVTAVLFLLQAVHLYWMTTNVAMFRAFGHTFWDPGFFWDAIIALVDYTEIPAIVSSSLLYVYQYRRGVEAKWRNILYIILINSQWLHLFWITDEILIAQFTGVVPVLIPVWLAWTAISIDYLEIPVMYDTVKKAIAAVREKRI